MRVVGKTLFYRSELIFRASNCLEFHVDFKSSTLKI